MEFSHFFSIKHFNFKLLSLWFRFFFWAPVLPVSFPGLWRLFLRQLLSPSPSYSTAFFRLTGKIQVLDSLYVFFHFYSIVLHWNSKILQITNYFLLVICVAIKRNSKFGLLAGIWWSVCITKSQMILYVSFSRKDSGLYLYHLSV